MHAAETWNTTAKDEQKLNAVMNECRRRVLGVTKMDKVTEEVLRAQVKMPEVRTLLAKRRLALWTLSKTTFAPKLVRLMVDPQFEKGRKIGSRVVQSWTKRSDGDIEWLNQQRGEGSKDGIINRLEEAGEAPDLDTMRRKLK